MKKRECGSCTKCCEGTLSGNVRGIDYGIGKPCFFVSIGKGCNIYEDRPYSPCKTYTCAWLDYDFLPYWMKPNEIDILCNIRQTPKIKIDYLEVLEAGSDMKANVLNWFIQYAKKNNLNLYYTIKGEPHFYGSEEFTDEFFSPE